MANQERSTAAGFTLIEILIVLALGLVLLISAYDLIDSTNRSYAKETGLADAQNAGRISLDVFASDLRSAGYSPLGYPFYAVANGNATRIRLIADLDGDGAVGLSGEENENLSYVFQGPDSAGLYTLVRGIDLNEDWSFAGTGESVSTVSTNVIQVDGNGDGTVDPFIVYDIAPPATTIAFDPSAPATSRVTVNFGVRSTNRDALGRRYPVVVFHSDVALRNLAN